MEELIQGTLQKLSLLSDEEYLAIDLEPYRQDVIDKDTEDEEDMAAAEDADEG